MLRKRKKNDNGSESDEAVQSRETLKASIPSAAVGPGAEKTIIGEAISIKGSIHGKGDLLIQGSIKGTIDLDNHHLTVGPNGKVEAEISAENVTISGRLTGNINARGKVDITKSAAFTGEIKAKRISVEDGAYLKAVIELEQKAKPRDPAKAAIPITKTPAPEKEKSL